MSDELANFGGSTESHSTQQRTNIEFENPSHPDKSAAYTSEEDAQAYFNAAVAAKSWPANRKVLIGEFLLAVEAFNDDGSTDELVAVMELLTGSTVTLDDE